MDWLYYGILVVVLIAGVALNVLTLPGNWLMLLAAAGYAWATGRRYVWWWSLGILALSLLAEVIEFAAAGRAAAKLGGSRWGTVGAVAGGLLGGLCLSGSLPFVFPISTIVGILGGTFLGSSAGELVAGKRIDTSLAIGTAATKGRFVGTLIKVAIGVVIALLAMVVALPVW
jgi:uncharacterized protein YqgC (DUF456 family)